MGCGTSSANTAVIAKSNSNLKDQSPDNGKNQVDEISTLNKQEKVPISENPDLNRKLDDSGTGQKSNMFCQVQHENDNGDFDKKEGSQIINEKKNGQVTDTTKDGTSEKETTETKEKPKVEKVPLTEEEIKEKINQTFEDALNLWKPFSDQSLLIDAETGKCSAKFRRIANNSFLYHFRLKELSLKVQDQFKMDYYRLMVKEGVVERFCDMLVYILKQGYEQEDGQMDEVMFKPLVNTYGILTNFTDNKIERADIVANHPEFLTCVAENLKKWMGRYLEEKLRDDQSKAAIRSPLSIFHNIAMQDVNIDRMRSLGFVELLTPFVNSPKEGTRLSAVATLADLVDEKESEIIRTDTRIMKFIKNSLGHAMNSKSRRQFGWSPQELARTVRRIARNDANKRALVEQGILPNLVKLAESEDIEEQREAVGAMWTLSFDKENQTDMIMDNECRPVDTFIRLKNSPDKEVRKTCNGALWTMREKLAESEHYKDIGEKFISPQSSPAHVATGQQQEVKSEGHIMISYQWGHQEMLKKIRNSLRANGFKVWMDIDDMEGSTLDAMARAVENAEVVLVCFSQKYKDSDNCRAEAEYAFQKKKKMIPLKMEQNYKPDGWLGFICGAKLFFDFGGKYTFDSRIEGLVKELRSKLSKDDVDGVIVPESASMISGAPVVKDNSVEPVYSAPRPAGGGHVTMATVESVKKWNDQDVDKWMTKHSLSKNQVKKITGVEIAFLILLKTESPDFFYKVLTDKLKMTDLLTIAQFRFALDDTKL